MLTLSTAAMFLAPFVGAVTPAQTTQPLPVSPATPASAAALHLLHPLLLVLPTHRGLLPPATSMPLMFILQTPLLVISCCCRLPQLLMSDRPDYALIQEVRSGDRFMGGGEP